MAHFHGPYDTGAGASFFDQQWRGFFSSLMSNGVVYSRRNKYAVTAATGMDLQVDTGSGLLNGIWVDDDATTTVTINAADPSNPRKDIVYLHADHSAKTVAIEKATGTPGASPAAPTVTDDATNSYVLLAEILVHAGDTAASQFTITDKRIYAQPYIPLGVLTLTTTFQTSGQPETGQWGGSRYQATLGAASGPAVNFKHKMLAAPSSITLSVVSSVNATLPNVTHISVDGFVANWSGSTNFTFILGTYSTVGNCLRAIHADGQFDIHCDGCDSLLRGRSLKGDLRILELPNDFKKRPDYALAHDCPECGMVEGFNTALGSADEWLLIPGWERRMEQAFLIRQAMEALKLPRAA